MEGTDDPAISSSTQWLEYGFKAKPGNVRRQPPVIAPYHLRLDWLMWFAAMSSWKHYPWLLDFAEKLLQNDAELLKQMGPNPFPETPPKYVRAVLYDYRFTTEAEKKETGNWWVRTPKRLYLPAIRRSN